MRSCQPCAIIPARRLRRNEREHAEEHSEDREQNHVAQRPDIHAPRRTSSAEKATPAHDVALCPCGELPLQVAAKDRLFNDAGDACKAEPSAATSTAVGRRQLFKRTQRLCCCGGSRGSRLRGMWTAARMCDRGLNARSRRCRWYPRTISDADPEQQREPEIERNAARIPRLTDTEQ